MLDSERSSNETNTNEANGQSAGAAPAPVAPAVPAALFQPPQVLFQPPAPPAPPSGGDRDAGERDSGNRDSGNRDSGNRDSGGRDFGGRDFGGRDPGGRAEPDAESGRTSRRTRTAQAQAPGQSDAADDQAGADAESGSRTSRRTRGRTRTRTRESAQDDDLFSADSAAAVAEAEVAGDESAGLREAGADDTDESASSRRRSRRSSRTRTRGEAAGADAAGADDDLDGQDGAGDDEEADGDGDGGEPGSATRRRRRKRRRGAVDTDALSPDDPPDTVVHVREAHSPADDVRAIKGSTRLEAKKQRRREGRESGRRRPPVITESEFLARRESVDRTMVVRQRGDRTQMAVLEDGVLVEHYVNRTTHASYVGNVYLGKVQNVLPSMEAAFVDIGKGRNAVLYAGEVNFDASGLEGQPKRIEVALKPGQSVIVQVTKDPVGHKGARLTSMVSLPGRYLVYVPGASMTGISRKLPDTERTRLKQILKKVTPEHAGVIVRTAAEGAAEAELDRDITRLAAQWESIEKKSKNATAPALLYGEPDLTIRVVRDVFNEDFHKLIVSGDEGWEIIDEYVRYVAPHLADRITRWDPTDSDDDVFAAYRIDEQLAKALDRKVWLPSGGSLVIDRTEAMTVVDVNTGKFTGQGGNLEETVTRNNLEAAEEIVRQLRLRDVGGIVVIDFIDMVLESNRDLVLRRLLECLARDRTKHQVAEVTSLGLVQMTRKRVGAGLLEAFSQQCECCNGRGVIVALDAPPEPVHRASAGTVSRPLPAAPAHAPGNGNGNGNGNANGRGQGNGSGRGGNASGRRGSRGDDDREARDLAFDTVQPETAQLDAAESGTAQAVTENGTDDNGTGINGTGINSTGINSTGTNGTDANGGRRTRRSTSAGTAFATAVLVEDTPAVVPVVTTVPPVTDPSPASATETDPAGPEAAPVRRTRTRAGSAVARVTIVTDPEPPAEAPATDESAPPADEVTPAPEASAAEGLAQAPETAPAPETPSATDESVPQASDPAPVAADLAIATVVPSAVAEWATPAEAPEAATEATAAPADEEAPEPDAAATPADQALPPAEEFPPTEAAALTAEPATPETATEPDPASDSEAASGIEPALVAASVFDAAPAEGQSAVEAPAPADRTYATEQGDLFSAESPAAPADQGDVEPTSPDAAPAEQ
jgi:ribonuclease E